MGDTSPINRPDDTKADSNFQRTLRELGFEPAESVHEYPLRFTKDDALRSLIESTYSEPRPIFIESESGSVRLPVVVASAKAVYVPYVARTGDSPAGCYSEPDWLLEGWVIPSGFDPNASATRVRLFVPAPFDDTLLWQVIPTDTITDEEIHVTSD